MKFFLIVFVLLFNSFFCLEPIDLAHVRGTYDCLKKEYKFISPLNGAISWETGFLHNIYEFGGSDYNSTRLVRTLFHKLFGNFDISRSVSSIAPYLTPFRIGKILGGIEKLRGSDKGSFEKAFKDIISGGGLTEKIQQINSKLKNINRAIKKSSKLKNVDSKRSELEAEKEDLKKSKNTVEAELKKFIKVKESAYKRLIELIVRALEEEGFFNDSSSGELSHVISVPYTVHKIFLSLLYRSSKSKADFKEFFESFRDTIGLDRKKFYNTALDDKWLKLVFENKTLDSFLSKVNSLSDKKFIKKLNLEYERIVYSMVIKNYYSGSTPQFSNWLKDTDYYSEKFTDCVENTIMNIINALLYDPKTRLFKIDNLEDRGIINPKEDVIGFYKKYFTSNDLDDEKRHSTWASIVSNLPGVPYFNAIDTKTNIVLRKSFEKPFIYGISDEIVDDKKEVEINGQKFILVNPKRYKLYEIKPSIPSFLIIFDNLFNLGLFVNLRDAYKEKSFDKVDLLLGWTNVRIIKEEDSTKIDINTDKDQSYTISIGEVHSDIVPSILSYNVESYYAKKFALFWHLLRVYFDKQKKIDYTVDKIFSMMLLYNRSFIIYEKDNFLDEFVEELVKSNWIVDSKDYFAAIINYISDIYPKNYVVLDVGSGQKVIENKGRRLFFSYLVKHIVNRLQIDDRNFSIIRNLFNSASDDEVEGFFAGKLYLSKYHVKKFFYKFFDTCPFKLKLYVLGFSLLHGLVDNDWMRKARMTFDIASELDVSRYETLIVGVISSLFLENDELIEFGDYSLLINQLNTFFVHFKDKFSIRGLDEIILCMLGGDTDINSLNDLEGIDIANLGSEAIEVLCSLIEERFDREPDYGKLNEILNLILSKYKLTDKFLIFVYKNVEHLNDLVILKLSALLLENKKLHMFYEKKKSFFSMKNESLNFDDETSVYLTAYSFYLFNYDPMAAIDFVFKKVDSMDDDDAYELINNAIIDAIGNFDLPNVESIIDRLKSKINILDSYSLKNRLSNRIYPIKP